jgi:hypothetical protein
MRTKEDIKKIKGETGQQLNFVDSVTTADKIQKKRLSIFIFLFFTVGISLAFLTYREFKNQHLTLKFPQVNFHLSDLIPRSDPLTSTLSSDPNSWKICLFDLSSSRLIYSRNCPPSPPPTILPSSPSAILKTSLPSGLDIKESFFPNNGSFDFSASITSPVQRLLLTINVFGSFSLSDSQKLLPAIAEALYWRFSPP